MKKMNSTKIILTTGTLLLCMVKTEARDTVILNNHNAINSIQQISQVKTVNHKIHEKIKLTSNSVELLNISLQQNPIAVLKIRLSAKAVKQVINTLPAEKKKKEAFLKGASKTTVTPAEKEFITKQLDAILKPVEQFFDIIQEYSSMVLPILKESLTNHNLLDKSLLMEYFSGKNHIKEFSASKANSFESLETLCNELLSFFNDLDASFTPEVETAYKELLKQLKAPKATPAT